MKVGLERVSNDQESVCVSGRKDIPRNDMMDEIQDGDERIRDEEKKRKRERERERGRKKEEMTSVGGFTGDGIEEIPRGRQSEEFRQGKKREKREKSTQKIEGEQADDLEIINHDL